MIINIFTILLGFLLLGAIGFSLWIFIRGLLEADPGISAAVIGVIGVLTAGIWSHYSARRREINSRHFIEKKNAYLHLINLIFDLFIASKKDSAITETQIQERLLEFKREFMVWGDQNVIEALAIYENKSTALLKQEHQPDTTEQLLIVDDLLRAIRKDLGHDDARLKRGSLVGMLLKAEERDTIISNKILKESS